MNLPFYCFILYNALLKYILFIFISALVILNIFLIYIL